MRVERWLDLIVPRRCAGCRQPGLTWCTRCAESLGCGRGRLVPPLHGCPPLLGVGGDYEGLLRSAVLLFKQRPSNVVLDGLVRLLADALGSVLGALAGLGHPPRPLALVPVPPRRLAAWRSPASELCVRLAGGSRHAEVLPLLRATPRVRAQKELGAAQRAVNAGFGVRHRHRPKAQRHIVLVDDVVTTGATLAAAARVLSAAEAKPVAALAAARTPIGVR